MRKKFIFSLLAIVVSLVSYSQIYEPVKWSFALKNTGKTTADVIIKATIEDGWHLYGMDIPKDGPRPTKIVFEDIQNAKPEGKIQGLSKLKEVYDPNFDMKLSWYANDAVFVQKISFADAAKVRLKGYVEFMVCNDESCLPPTQEYFDLGSKLVEASKPVDNLVQSDSVGADSTVAQTVTVEGKTDYWSPVVEELKAFGNAEGATGETSLWLIFLAGLAGGFLALFTPCVWPIIPMTVSFFLKRSDDKKRGTQGCILIRTLYCVYLCNAWHSYHTYFWSKRPEQYVDQRGVQSDFLRHVAGICHFVFRGI